LSDIAPIHIIRIFIILFSDRLSNKEASRENKKKNITDTSFHINLVD
jgi:hypothetical protein